MANNNIATASVLLRANGAQLDSGLNKAGKSVEAWSLKIGENLSFVSSSFKKVVGLAVVGKLAEEFN